MRYYPLYIFLVASCVFMSCKDKNTMGDVSYHPSFLWSKASIVPVEKTFDFDFSEDAQNDPHSYAELQFTDNDHQPISTDIMQVSIDGEPLRDNKFRIDSKVKSQTLSFTFTPEAKSGKYQGVLRLVGHDLDRLDTQVLSPGQQVDVMQWTLYYEKSMNPLANGLMWLLILVAAALLLWFLLLRRFCYPTFHGVHKFQVVDPYYSSKTLTGKRLLILCSEKPAKPQGALNKLFTGEIVYEVNPLWKTPIEVVPAKKSAHATNKPGYLFLSTDGVSLPTKWVVGGEYIIEILDSNEKVRIKII